MGWEKFNHSDFFPFFWSFDVKQKQLCMNFFLFFLSCICTKIQIYHKTLWTLHFTSLFAGESSFPPLSLNVANFTIDGRRSHWDISSKAITVFDQRFFFIFYFFFRNPLTSVWMSHILHQWANPLFSAPICSTVSHGGVQGHSCNRGHNLVLKNRSAGRVQIQK